MNATLSFLVQSSVISWFIFGVFCVVAIGVFVIHYRPLFEQRRARLYLHVALGVGAFRLLAAAVKTGLQYYAWTLSDMTRYLLPPYQSIRVLLHYSWTHFWLNALISIGAALLFFVVLRSLRAYNPRYFETGEVELGLLLALIAGWPHFLVFIPAVFLAVVIVSIVRGIFLREPYTTMGLPFFIGYAVAVAVTSYVIAAFGLTGYAI